MVRRPSVLGTPSAPMFLRSTSRNAIAVDTLDKMGHEVTPLFITIDPQRDTVDAVADFAEDMHPVMIALTASDARNRDTAQEYRMFFANGSGAGDVYLMDHSTLSCLMFPETGLGTYFGRAICSEDMARETACHFQSG